MNFHFMIQTQFHTKFKFFVLIMVLSISITPWALTYKKMVLYIKVLVLTPLSKTGLQNGKRDIFLKLLVLCCLHLTCPHNFGVTPFWQPHILLTECLVGSYLLSHPSINSKSFFLILDLMHIFHFVSLGLPCLSTLTDLSGTNLIPECLNVSFLATLPHKRATNVVTQFHRSYMLA